MSAPPDRPAQAVAEVTSGPRDQCGEQVLELVAGDRDQPGWRRVAGAFGQGGHDQEGVGNHGQGGPPIPGAPAADLVLVQPD
jgi:hypothetical protein